MKRGALPTLYLLVFMDLFGFGVVLPALPFHIMNLQGHEAVWGALVAMSYSVGQLAGAPLLGRVSDRYGRRPVLIFSLIGSTAALTATGLASDIAGLIAARLIAGLCAGSISTAQAYIADLTEPQERARYMGLLGACMSGGFIFGPAVGGWLGEHGFQTACFVAAAIAGVNLLMAIAFLAESRPADKRGKNSSQQKSLEQFVTTLRSPSLGPLLWANAFAMLAFVGMEVTFPYLGKANFDLTPSSLGSVFAYTGFVSVIIQAGLIGNLTKRFGEIALARTGVIGMAIALGSLPFVYTFVPMILSISLLAAGSSLLTPSLSSLLSRRSAASEQGTVMGVSQGVAAGARALGPGLAGGLFDLRMFLPYAVGSLLMLLCLPMLRRGTNPAGESADSEGADSGSADSGSADSGSADNDGPRTPDVAPRPA